MTWILDTSAFARRDVPAVAALLAELLEHDELALAPAVLLELLRGPQRSDVAAFRAELETSFRVLEAGPEVFALVASAMVELAATGPRAHRLPIADLHTAALAHLAGAGVLHLDGDYPAIAETTSLDFAHRAVCTHEDLGSATGPHPAAARQRELRAQLNQLLHAMPVVEAEAFLKDAVLRAGGGREPERA